jgi:hypothetical protein
MSFSFSPYLIKNHRDPKYVYVKNMQCAAETFLGIKVSCHKILPEVCHKLKKVENHCLLKYDFFEGCALVSELKSFLTAGKISTSTRWISI